MNEFHMLARTNTANYCGPSTNWVVNDGHFQNALLIENVRLTQN